MTISIQSQAFAPDQPIPQTHTGDGQDISPALEWTGIPAGAAELVLIVDDPDAPVAEPWVHWVLYGIPPGCQGLPGGFHGEQTPPGLGGLRQGTNSWNTTGYRGPSPPRGHGPHHYRFTLYALDQALGLRAGLDKARVLEAMRGHVIGEGQIVGTYERPGP